MCAALLGTGKWMPKLLVLAIVATELSACAQHRGHQPVEWTPREAGGTALPHYKAYAANALGDGGWISGASDPWSAVTYALDNCERRPRTKSPCRVEYLGNSTVEHLEGDGLIAAILEYYTDDDASFDTLEELQAVTVANRADGVASVAAIAVVPQEGRRYWALELGDTFKDAERAAVSACGHSKCVAVDYYLADSCVIVVAGDTQIFWGGGKYTIDEVMSFCSTESNHCEIVKQVCTD
jgi:hypothetical protein